MVGLKVDSGDSVNFVDSVAFLGLFFVLDLEIRLGYGNRFWDLGDSSDCGDSVVSVDFVALLRLIFDFSPGVKAGLW